MATQFSVVNAEIQSIEFGTIDIDASEFATILTKYVHEGSKRHRLSKSDITVFFNIAGDFPDKEDAKIQDFSGKKAAKTVKGLMAAGAKFMDAVFWLALTESERPEPLEHPAAKPPQPQTFSTYNNHQDIARCMFFYLFYVLTRARAPVAGSSRPTEPVPKFLAQVLGIKKGEAEVADYLSSFSLENIDPSWVRHIDLAGLSQESMNRFGLGVAGYRMAAPFKLQVPDHPDASKFQKAINVAISFATSPADWDFHPSTRKAELLTKYGNINQNLGNLILKVYKPDTIEEMVKVKILFKVPDKNPAHTNYTMWDDAMKYSPTSKIFTK